MSLRTSLGNAEVPAERLSTIPANLPREAAAGGGPSAEEPMVEGANLRLGELNIGL